MAGNKTKTSEQVAKPTNMVAGAMPGTLKLSFILGVISLLVYANTLKNGFCLDDSVMIMRNHLVTKGVSAIPELLATPHQWGFWQNPNDEYRPLSLVLFSMVYEVFNINPAPYHLMNVLLFAGCVILLFLFLCNLFAGQRRNVALITALLFALHPIHTEVVANIKSADELLCFFCVFLALNTWIAYVESGKRWQLITGACCFFLAFLSKETAITFVVIIPLVFFCYRNEHKKKSVYITLSALLATALFLVIRMAVLSHYHVNSRPQVEVVENMLAMQGLSLESRLATAILILGLYVKLLFIPFPLINDYSTGTIPLVHFSDPWVLISLAFYLFVAIVGITRFLKNQKDPYAFAILFFLLTISLFSNLLLLIKATAGERFLFFPVIGFCMLVALLLEKVAGTGGDNGINLFKRPVVAAILYPLCIVYAILTFDRNGDWLDNYTLYSTDLKHAPNNSRLNYFMGDLLLTGSNDERDPAAKTQIIKNAISYYCAAVASLPDYYLAQADLGAAYFDVGMYDSAIVHDRAAMAINPLSILPANNLTGLYMHTGQYPQAVIAGENAIAISPLNKVAYANVSFSFFSLKQFDSAVVYSREGIAVAPDFDAYYRILATTYKAMGIMDSAVAYESIARRYNPAFHIN